MALSDSRLLHEVIFTLSTEMEFRLRGDGSVIFLNGD